MKKLFTLDENIKLTEVLDLHHSHKHFSELAFVLCDGYLYHHNLYLRNLRDVFKKLGGLFTSENIFHYHALQGASLSQMLETKKIYYFDNVTRLDQIENLRPNRFHFAEIGCTPNYIHHECSHLLADQLFSKELFETISFKDSDQKETLRIEMGEAVASTHDLLTAFGLQTMAGKQIYKFYGEWEAFKPKEMNIAFDCIDFSGTYKCVFFGFLYSYMLHRYVEQKETDYILSMLFPNLDFNATQKKSINKIMNWSTDQFLYKEVEITNFYLRLRLENNRDIFDLVNFNFLRLIEKNPEIINRLHCLADSMQSGLTSKPLQSFLLDQSNSLLKVA